LASSPRTDILTARARTDVNEIVEQRSDLLDLIESADDFAASARSDATTRAYSRDWMHFEAWCHDHDLEALPADPSTVALYVTDMATSYKPSTITRRLASISVVHGTYGHLSPTRDPRVQTVTRGVRRRLGVNQTEARPLSLGDHRQMHAYLPAALSGTPVRALLLIGVAGAFRRSELVALDVDDLERRPEGLVVHVRASKTDQEGDGRQAAILYGIDSHTCPVTAIDAWTAQADIADGALFRSVDRHGNVSSNRLSGQSVSIIIKRAADGANIDSSGLSGHSLRAGFATTAAANGASESSIARQTGHKSMEMLRRYVRHGTVFTDNAVSKVGL
jgi:integrase